MDQTDETKGPMRRLTNTHSGAISYWFFCLGCDTHHSYQTHRGTGEHAHGPEWEFNGNDLKPSFTPSLLVNGVSPVAEVVKRGGHRCHLYVTLGMVKYLGDCSHELKNKTVPISPPRI